MGVSQVCDVIVRRYINSRAGRTGAGQRDLIFPFNELLRDAGCLQGITRHEALVELEDLEREGFLVLERHKRDASAILRLRLPLKSAEGLLIRLGQIAPETQRRAFADMLTSHAEAFVPPEYQEDWRHFCQEAAAGAISGASIVPLDSSNLEASSELLGIAAKLLSWKDESYLRFASCVLCGDSKKLGRLQAPLERLLEQITSGKVASLAELGITESGGGCWVHGPGVLITSRGRIDLDALDLPAHFSKSDLITGGIESAAERWISVENETMLLELAKLHSGIMLLSSGFRGGVANTVVIKLLRSAPITTELWHFGDSDPKGFDILRDLRARAGRKIRSLHMGFRPAENSPVLSAEDHKIIQRLLASDIMSDEEKGDIRMMFEAGTKGSFEQESLGRPNSAWPLY